MFWSLDPLSGISLTIRMNADEKFNVYFKFSRLWSFKSIKHNCCVKIVLRAISFAHIIQRFKEILTRYHVPKLSNLFFQMVIKIYFTSQVNMFSSSSLAPTPYPFCDFIFVPRKIREVRESTVTFDVTDRLNFFLMSLTS